LLHVDQLATNHRPVKRLALNDQRCRLKDKSALCFSQDRRPPRSSAKDMARSRYRRASAERPSMPASICFPFVMRERVVGARDATSERPAGNSAASYMQNFALLSLRCPIIAEGHRKRKTLSGYQLISLSNLFAPGSHFDSIPHDTRARVVSEGSGPLAGLGKQVRSRERPSTSTETGALRFRPRGG
jgi:hypothetical protein